MIKKILAIIIALLLVGTIGCSLASSTTTTVSPASVKTLREVKIGPTWEMKHLEVSIGTEISILLELAERDTVDGYFYLEKGNNINFRVTGNSLVYESKSGDIKNPQGVASDRFSFTATKEQGIAYSLTFTNPSEGAEASKVTVFLDIIYPATGKVFIPIDTQ